MNKIFNKEKESNFIGGTRGGRIKNQIISVFGISEYYLFKNRNGLLKEEVFQLFVIINKNITWIEFDKAFLVLEDMKFIKKIKHRDQYILTTKGTSDFLLLHNISFKENVFISLAEIKILEDIHAISFNKEISISKILKNKLFKKSVDKLNEKNLISISLVNKDEYVKISELGKCLVQLIKYFFNAPLWKSSKIF